MSAPSTTNFFDAAEFVYRDESDLPAGLTPLTNANGQAIASLKTADGFYGAAYETTGGKIIVAFEGTDLGGVTSNPGFVEPQLQADQQIYEGQNPAAYTDALRLTRWAVQVARADGISRNDVFVDGHSLGGAEAEYVAARTGLGGDTFGAPGIPSSDIAPGETSHLVNYVDYGDPVGNYGATPNKEGNFLASPDIVRFGAATYVGEASTAKALGQAGALYGETPVGSAAAIGILAKATVDHHLLQDYATDLGIAPATSTPGWMSNLTVGQITGLISGLLGSGTGALASSGGSSIAGEFTQLAQVISGASEALSGSSLHVQASEPAAASFAADTHKHAITMSV